MEERKRNLIVQCPQPPCKDCKDRTLTCHDTCPKFAEFKKANEELKRARRNGNRKW